MKVVMRNCVVFLMTAILFVASTGFTLFSHICFMNGERKVSAQKIESCCSHEEKPVETEISSPCCKNNSQFLKFDFTGTNRTIQDFSDLPLVALYIFPDISIFSIPELLLPTNDLPPPKSGRDIISQKQVFRI